MHKAARTAVICRESDWCQANVSLFTGLLPSESKLNMFVVFKPLLSALINLSQEWPTCGSWVAYMEPPARSVCRTVLRLPITGITGLVKPTAVGVSGCCQGQPGTPGPCSHPAMADLGWETLPVVLWVWTAWEFCTCFPSPLCPSPMQGMCCLLFSCSWSSGCVACSTRMLSCF